METESNSPDPLGSRPTEHAIDTYTPQPREHRKGIALCLSGGGYRAALFHLGALRRLNELRILTRVDTVSSVSGGSIIAAHLARHAQSWPGDGTPLPDWERRIAQPFRRFCKRNIRTKAMATRLWPWNWRKSDAPALALARAYERHLLRTGFSDLPDRPRFIFCATDIVFGANWVFDSEVVGSNHGRVGDWQAGYRTPIPATWSVGRAVAASSCFPPVFDPLPIGLQPGELGGGAYRKPDRDELVTAIRLSDGGVYDNMGLEPVWKDHRVVLVSDGGGVFEGELHAHRIGRAARQLAIVESQSRALRKRWLIGNFIEGDLEGTYWGIGSSTARYNAATPGYSQELVDDVVSEIRTDLDAFSDAEIAALENHGYLMAEAAIQRHAPRLVGLGAPSPDIPHPHWRDEALVRSALKHSHKRSLLGRW